MTPPPNPSDPRLARQRRVLLVLGAFMVITGVVVLAALKRLPVPVRMMAGLGDILIGCVLLVAARQMKR